MMINRNRKGGIVVEALIFLLALGLIVKAGMAGATTYKFVHLAMEADGKITSIGNHGFTVTVQSAPIPGEGVIFSNDGFFFNYNTGDEVPVLYDPNDPQHAEMDNFSALWFDTLVRGFAGLFFFIWGLRMHAHRSL